MIVKIEEVGEVEVNSGFIYAATTGETETALTECDNIDGPIKAELEAIAEDIRKKAERIKEIAFGLPRLNEWDNLSEYSNGERLQTL